MSDHMANKADDQIQAGLNERDELIRALDEANAEIAELKVKWLGSEATAQAYLEGSAEWEDEARIAKQERDELRTEVERLKKQLREYEHETETIAELKRKLAMESALLCSGCDTLRAQVEVAVEALKSISDQGFWSRKMKPAQYYKILDEYKEVADRALSKLKGGPE